MDKFWWCGVKRSLRSVTQLPVDTGEYCPICEQVIDKAQHIYLQEIVNEHDLGIDKTVEL